MSSIITEIGSLGSSTESEDLETSTISGGLNLHFSAWGLLNVPDHLRKQYERAFTPQLLPIGPIHHFDEKLQTMEICKQRFLDVFIQRANLNKQKLRGTIEGRVEDIHSFYGKAFVSRISSGDFVEMILVDGVFILEYILRQCYPHLVVKDPMIVEWTLPILKLDLVLLENQLPFFVLEMLFEQANFGAELLLKPDSLKELVFEFFQCYNFQMKGRHIIEKIQHFTDLVRLFYLSDPLPCRLFSKAKLSYNATELHETGVKFKCVSLCPEVIPGSTFVPYRRSKFVPYRRSKGHGGFLGIMFNLNNGVLEIPCIKLNNEIVLLIQNIIALEQTIYAKKAYVTDFFVLLDFLIKSIEDVDLLCDKGILINCLSDSNEAASTFSNLKFLNTKISGYYMNAGYLDICKDLNAFCNRPWQRRKATWYRWREMLWHEYFSTPWRAASTSGAIILLVFTAIQTVCSLKSIK